MSFEPGVPGSMQTRGVKIEVSRWLLAMAVLLASFSLGGGIRADSGDRVVATIGGRKITEREVDEKIKVQTALIQNQLYELKKGAIESIADDYLLDKAASRAKLSKAAYLKREVDDKVQPPTDAQQQKYYDLHKAQIRQPLDKIKPQLANFMKNQALNQGRQQLLARLRSKAGFRSLLQPPRFQVVGEGSATLGPKDAPVTMIEFSDYQCPYCRRAETSVRELRQKYGEKLQLVYRDYPLPIHQYAMKAAEAARRAQEQGKFWPYHDTLFGSEAKLEVADLKADAAKLGLDTKKFNDCLDHDKYAAAVRQDMADGTTSGVHGTPAFFINGRFIDGAQPTQAFEQVIDDELGRARPGQQAVAR